VSDPEKKRAKKKRPTNDSELDREPKKKKERVLDHAPVVVPVDEDKDKDAQADGTVPRVKKREQPKPPPPQDATDLEATPEKRDDGAPGDKSVEPGATGLFADEDVQAQLVSGQGEERRVVDQVPGVAAPPSPCVAAAPSAATAAAAQGSYKKKPSKAVQPKRKAPKGQKGKNSTKTKETNKAAPKIDAVSTAAPINALPNEESTSWTTPSGIVVTRIDDDTNGALHSGEMYGELLREIQDR